MITNEQQNFLRSTAKQYLLTIKEALAHLGLVADQLQVLQTDGTKWFDSLEVFDDAFLAGLNLAFLNRLVDNHRYDWDNIDNLPNPLLAYDLANVLAGSLIICKSPTKPEEALKLPLVSEQRLEELYTQSVHELLDKVKLPIEMEQLLPPQQTAPQVPRPSSLQLPPERF